MSSKQPIYSVILSGGSGTRLWPISRNKFPKQFIDFNDSETLFKSTFNRLRNSSYIKVDKFLIIANEDHRFLVLDQLKDCDNTSIDIILEPIGKNTAPALTLAAMQAIKDKLNPILIVTPSDQKIQDFDKFNIAISKAIQVAQNNEIAILGVEPTYPETGYGYIKCEKFAGESSKHIVNKFTEKPSLDLAKKYLATGEYYWNSGIVVVSANIWLEAIRNFKPDIYNAVFDAFNEKVQDGKFIRPDPKKFNQIPSDSIDYAVLEKCPYSYLPLKMVILNSKWSDFGSWGAVWDLGVKDSLGNVLDGNIIIEQAENNLVIAESRLVSVIGVDNLIIIETADALLITDRKDSQKVRLIVDKLKNTNREELENHRKVIRPWGWYDTIDNGYRFKVKRIQVNPGASLSLQKHLHRAEHWIVVKGRAKIDCGDKSEILEENESTYIPVGEIHRLSNPGPLPLELIEVQSGEYLSEDDIIRMNDVYGRN